MITLLTSERRHTPQHISRFKEEATNLGVEMSFIKPSDLNYDAIENGEQVAAMLGHETDGLLVHMGASTITEQILKLIDVCASQIPVINTTKTYEFAGDKWVTYQRAVETGIPTPETILVNKTLGTDGQAAQIQEKFSFPVVIKGIKGARGEQVFLCRNKEDLLNVLNEYLGLDLIAQQFIATSYGTDLRVYIVDSKPVAAIKRSSQDTFRANIAQGGHGIPVEISDVIFDLSCRVAEAFKFEVGGIDLLLGENDQTFYLTELNIFTVFDGVEEATKVNIAQPILLMMQRKIEKFHSRKKSK